jgi:cytochrome c oxidase subunit 2
VPCHGEDGSGTRASKRPEIAGLPQWYVERQLIDFKTSMRGAHPQDGPGARMRPMARSLYREGDVASVAEYVADAEGPVPAHDGPRRHRRGPRALPVGVHRLPPGGRLGQRGARRAAARAASTTGTCSQLGKFKSGMRGAHPDDVMGQQMAAMSATLADSTAIHDVVAFIRTLQK